jgi:uncharacterized protein (DUF1499 family)
MGKFFLFLLLLVLAFTGFLFIQAKNSARQSSPQLTGNELPPCGDKPNCVSSSVNPSDSHYIEPLESTDTSMQQLQQLVERDGGTVAETTDQHLTATYKSGLFGFIDDLILLHRDGKIHVRSSSRVGYSDFDANRKRVERLRTALSQQSS